MKIKKLYTFTNKRHIWRLLPFDDKLMIEERDPENKEVFFNCIETESGDTIFNNLQLEEKFWIGIEKISDGFIFFHKYEKPDLPRHKGISAFDIETKKVVWENSDLTFLFIYDQKVFCYLDKFEGRLFFTLDVKTGNLLEELGSDVNKLNELREKIIIENEYEDYRFPEVYSGEESSDAVNKIIQDIKEQNVITGPIDVIYRKNLLYISFFEVLKDGLLNNIFQVVDIDGRKVIFEEILNSSVKTIIPDSFFLKKNLIFLLKEKIKLVVCLIKE